VPCLLSDTALLDRAIARFKTPGLRDLSHSAPYMHNGQFATLNDITSFTSESRIKPAQERCAMARCNFKDSPSQLATSHRLWRSSNR
jgi:cytochrome c peroxidase